MCTPPLGPRQWFGSVTGTCYAFELEPHRELMCNVERIQHYTYCKFSLSLLSAHYYFQAKVIMSNLQSISSNLRPQATSLLLAYCHTSVFVDIVKLLYNYLRHKTLDLHNYLHKTAIICRVGYFQSNANNGFLFNVTLTVLTIITVHWHVCDIIGCYML